MTARNLSSKNSQSQLNKTRLLWVGIGAAAIVILVVVFVLLSATALPFKMTGGEISPVVFLRNDNTVYYDFEYTGGRPANLTRIIPRIQLFQGQLLTVDVQATSIVFGDAEIALDDGYFPEGTDLELQQGDTFQFGVTYLGQELGWNRIHGFRLQYTSEGRAFDELLELKDDYYVFVE